MRQKNSYPIHLPYPYYISKISIFPVPFKKSNFPNATPFILKMAYAVVTWNLHITVSFHLFISFALAPIHSSNTTR